MPLFTLSFFRLSLFRSLCLPLHLEELFHVVSFGQHILALLLKMSCSHLFKMALFTLSLMTTFSTNLSLPIRNSSTSLGSHLNQGRIFNQDVYLPHFVPCLGLNQLLPTWAHTFRNCHASISLLCIFCSNALLLLSIPCAVLLQYPRTIDKPSPRQASLHSEHLFLQLF